MRRRQLLRAQTSKSQTGSLARRFNSGPVLSFNPASIPGCQLWLDAADTSSVALNSSSNVLTWIDKSGNERNTTTTGTVSYANSGVSIADSYLTGSFGSPDYTGTTLTCFIVASMSVTSGSVARAFSLGKVGTQDWDNLGSFAAFTRGGGLILRAYRTSASSSPPSIPGYDARFLATSGQTSSLMFSSINGGTMSTNPVNGAFAINAYRIGTDLLIDDANEQFNGIINEIIVYFSDLTTSQRQKVEGYLAHKWDLLTIPSPTTPLTIPGCSLWLDAADPSTLTLNGTDVTQWNDKSGSGRNVTQVTSELRPTYSAVSKAVVFNGTRYLDIPTALAASTPTYTIFVVEKRASGDARFFIGGRGSTLVLGYNGSTQSHHTTMAISDMQISIPAYLGASEPLRLKRFAYTGSTRSTFINRGQYSNSQSFSATLTSWSNANIGGGFTTSTTNWYIGNIYEIIFYNATLTSQQIQQVEHYLANKWGLHSSLPANHPHKTAAPTYEEPVFVPTLISRNQLWLDAADQSSMTLSGSNVTQWNDKSGIGNNAVANTGTVTTNSTRINGLNTIRFSTSSFLTISSFAMAANVSMFAVIRGVGSQGSGNFGYFFIGMGLEPSFFLYTLLPSFGNISGPFSALVASNGETNWYMPSSDFFLNNPGFIYTDNSTSFVNGSQLTRNPNRASVPNAVSAATYSNLQIGGRVQADSLAFDFAELLFYNNTLTPSQRQRVEGYLANKWGLQSSLPANHPYKTIAPTGIPRSITIQSLSALFNNSYLTIPPNAALTLGTNNHTIEFWMYQTSRGQYDCAFMYDNNPQSLSTRHYYFNVGSAQFYLLIGNGVGGWAVALNCGTSPSLNAWHHYAIVRNGTTFTVYLNGISIGSTTASPSIPAQNNPMNLGVAERGEGNISGYMTNFRFVNGTAVYTSNFTPPTSPLSAIPNTQILLQGLVDRSANAFTVTNSGGVTLSTLSPFV